MKNIIYFTLTSLILLSLGCTSDEGEGGTSTIRGKVIIEEFEELTCELVTSYNAVEQDVYLVFGSDSIYSLDFKTHFNGNYQFDFLKKGTYYVYAYSECLECDTNCVSNKFPVIKEVVISNNGESVDGNNIIIKEKF